MPHTLLTQRTKVGTLGGTLLTIFGNIQSEDIVRTALLAAIGAVVSFAVSVVCKAVWERIGPRARR